MKKGLLIILSGPSGVGKGTVRKYLMEHGDVELTFSVSMTTRAPRNQEIDGVDYYFVSQEVFQQNLDIGNFLEHAEFVGNRYGTPKDKVEELRNQGKNVFLEIEVNGASQVMKSVKDEGVVSIFLMPPSLEDLASRIKNRKTESKDIIEERLNKGKSEMLLSKNYEYVIKNDDVERASNEILEILHNKLKQHK